MYSNTHNEKQLCQLVSAGDEQAFEALFNLYVPKITPLALKLTHDREVAKEIVQETFLRIWLTRDKLAGIENPAGWIFTIAANQCYRYLRRKTLQQSLQVALPGTEDLHDIVNVEELSSLVNKAVVELTEQRRTVYLLSRVHGLTIPEIGKQLGLSPNTVKNTLVTALKSIRDYLYHHGYQLPLFLLYWIQP